MKEQQFSAPSPYDHNPTEPIGKRAHPLSHTSDPSKHPHELTTEPSFQKAEFLFDPRNPRGVKLFDTSLLERNQLETELNTQTFTADELAEQGDQDNPHYQALLEAREELDKYTVRRLTRFNMDGPVRRELKKNRRTAQAAFDVARRDYIESKLAPEESITTLAQLTVARAELAEAAHEARQGKLFGNKKALRNLEAAQQDYADLRDTYFDEQLRKYNPGTSKHDRQQLRASLKDHERGALAGEEANVYLTEVNDENKKTYFRKITDRYNTLSRPRKLVAGIGVVALSGVGFGAIGGFAAIGGVAAVKFGRAYIHNEAKRLENANDLHTQQEASVLHAGNLESSLEERTIIDENRRKEAVFIASQQSYQEQHDAAVAKESARIAKDRRTSLAKAALITALPFAGGALGALAEQAVPDLSHGLFRERGIPQFNLPSFHTDNDSQIDHTQPSDTEPETDILPDSPSESAQPPQPETPAISPRQLYLYDTFAGHTITISLSGQNSSIWQEVSKTIASEQPTASFLERERLTGNIVNEILRQNPTINPESLSVGQRITTKMPS